MSVCLRFRPAAVLLLFSAPNPAFAEAARELPGGDSPAFRGRMTDWSAPAGNEADTHIQRPSTGVTVQSELPRLTSQFGIRKDPFTGGYRHHSGIDIAAPPGTAIRSAAGGRVSFAGRAGGYGNMIELDHGNGLRTRYAHLSRILVGSGSTVAGGEIIAEAGSTGRSTGSHLHFEVREDGNARNPLAYLKNSSWIAPTSEPIRARKPHLSAFARSRVRGSAGGGEK
jgi:murein DD-endopeptidase MepM/ murein hydrolase activator NlpD